MKKHYPSKFIDFTAMPCIDIDVSVIIPVYNAMPYLEEAVNSALSQNSESLRVEVICINDGSTDDSLEFLLQKLANQEFLRIINQPNSGAPSQPRNRGLEEATGEFVLFLDADDVIYPNALEKMVAEARATGNAQVLGKIAGIGGREALRQIFRKTNHDADLLKSYAWHNLAPIGKLIRRDLIESLKLRFNEDQWVGEDQVFFSQLYLKTDGISILADQEYVGYRLRDDGQNITGRQQTLTDKQKIVTRLGRNILETVAPGAIRDQLAQRIFTSTLPGVMNNIYKKSSPLERARFVGVLRDEITELYTSHQRNAVNKFLQIAYDLLFHGAIEDLDVYLENNSRSSLSYIKKANKLEVDLPQFRTVSETVIDRQAPQNGILEVSLTALACHDLTLHLSGTATFKGVKTSPDSLKVLLRERSTGEQKEIPVELCPESEKTAGNDCSTVYSVSLSQDLSIAPGAWGTFINANWGESVVEARWGKRPASIPNEKYLFYIEKDTPCIAYFNADYENLTLDVGPVVHSAQTLGRLQEQTEIQ